MTRAIHGIYAVLYALFDESGRLDRYAFRTQVETCIRAGAHGIAVLGLATEVNKLSTAERRLFLEWAAEDIAGRIPLAVTIAEASVDEQVAFAQVAQDVGADWLILQPPPVRGLSEAEYVRFFGSVADRVSLPVAIQNAPDYIGIGLSVAGLRSLSRNHANISLFKAETSSVGLREIVEELGDAVRIFNGRGGLELIENLQAGCAGLIVAPECLDVQVQIYEAFRRGQLGDLELAEELYRSVLPLIVFTMQSIQHFLCYGKRVFAARAGLGPVFDRAPALAPTPFGLERAAVYASRLGGLR